MIESMANHWWMVLIRGLAAVLFGMLAIAWPRITLLTFILLFAVHALIDGVVAISVGLNLRRTGQGALWGPLVIAGVLSVLAGLFAVAWPGLTAAVFLGAIAFWAVSRGVFEIAAAIRLRQVIPNEWLLALAGCCSILFGVLLIAWPAAGLMSLMWLV